MTHYLDHAATTRVRPEVFEAVRPYLTDRFGNPSSHHAVGEAAAQDLADARARIADVVGMRPGDIVFTSGGTESNNLAIQGIVVAQLLRYGRPGHVVTTGIEHSSILETCEFLSRAHGTAVTHVPVGRTGLVAPEAVAAALREDTALVTLAYANNEVGTVLDVAAIAEACGRVPLHVDAVQAAGWLPLAGTGASALSVAGHKIGALPGTGFLALRSRIPLEPVLHGGGQERGRRSGTQNVAGAIGLAVALELAEAERAAAVAHVGAYRDAFVSRVLALLPEAQLTGDPHHRLAGSASFVFPGVAGEAILLELERRGIISSSGSACSADSTDPSHVLLAMGMDPDTAYSAVRFTFGRGASADADDPQDLAATVAAAVIAAGPAGLR